jgi:hypothetical protein
MVWVLLALAYVLCMSGWLLVRAPDSSPLVHRSQLAASIGLVLYLLFPPLLWYRVGSRLIHEHTRLGPVGSAALGASAALYGYAVAAGIVPRPEVGFGHVTVWALVMWYCVPAAYCGALARCRSRRRQGK